MIELIILAVIIYKINKFFKGLVDPDSAGASNEPKDGSIDPSEALKEEIRRQIAQRNAPQSPAVEPPAFPSKTLSSEQVAKPEISHLPAGVGDDPFHGYYRSSDVAPVLKEVEKMQPVDRGVSANAPKVALPAFSPMAAKSSGRCRSKGLLRQMQKPSGFRNAFILKELLDKPKSERSV